MTELVKISDEAAAIGLFGGVSRALNGFLWIVMHGSNYTVCSGFAATREQARDTLLAKLESVAKKGWQEYFYPSPRVGGCVMEFFGKTDDDRRKVEMH